MAAPRAKPVPTAEHTRSKAAAHDSAASGSASNIWHGMPADRSTSRVT